MIDLFKEIGSLLAEEGYGELRYWWRVVQRWINGLLTAVLVWPIATIICAIFSPWMAQRVVPILAFAPMAFMLYLVAKLINPATLAATVAFPKVRDAVERVFRKVALVIAIELVLGLYLWLVPISNDRWLVPGLALAVSAFFALRLAQVGAGIRGLLALLIIGITIVFVVGGRGKMAELWQSLETVGATNNSTNNSTNAEVVCTDAFTQEAKRVNNYQGQNPTYFDITLRDDCFGENVYPPLPNAWMTWGIQFVDDLPDHHVWFWFPNSHPVGPYKSNPVGSFPDNSGPWRLKGRGTLRFYRVGGTIPPLPAQPAPIENGQSAREETGSSGQVIVGPPPIPPVQADNYKFTIRGCVRSITRIYCSGTIVNTSPAPLNFIQHRRSGSDQVVDNLGNQLTLRDNWLTIGNGNGIELQPDVPVKFSAYFDDPDRQATHVNIGIAFYPIQSSQHIEALLKNVPLDDK